MTIFLHVNNKTFKALCQVRNTDDCLLMGRALAKTIGYIDYPDIKSPTKIKQNTQTNIKVVQAKTNTVDTESTSEPQQNQLSRQVQSLCIKTVMSLTERPYSLFKRLSMQYLQA